ncbi:uncharacterized protein LOC113324491 [Papaver somniferum]|uniref:uncharacterized protein LOC113324491 n=1 Tax=Papaver somniferum TaxID=3469 RepID=UPI000E6F8EA1|nr:uncharacterized protein LOC113324491 [Papaver somniferum]
MKSYDTQSKPIPLHRVFPSLFPKEEMLHNSGKRVNVRKLFKQHEQLEKAGASQEILDGINKAIDMEFERRFDVDDSETCKELTDTTNKLQLQIDNINLQLESVLTKDEFEIKLKAGLDSHMLSIQSMMRSLMEELLSTTNFHQGDHSGAQGHNLQVRNSFHNHSGGRDYNHRQRLPKIDFPRFDGDNPKGWLNKCEYFFQMHEIPEFNKSRMAAMHFDGKAAKWFENFRLNRPHISWQDLSSDVCLRLKNPSHENIVGMFNKLSQLTTVDAYFEEFEHLKALLLSKHNIFTEEYFIRSFIGGLKEELRGQYLCLPPVTPASSTQSSSFTSNPLPKHNTSIPIKRLTPEQVQARKARGLYYNCDEVYKRGHVCKQQHLCLMIGAESEDSSLDTEEATPLEKEDSPMESDMEISLHALTSNNSGETIRIPGLIKKRNISVLIDTSSTHSFIDSDIARQLNCTIEPTASMLVTLANGDRTVSNGICSNLNWFMHNHKFSGSLRLLPLGGCDLVLEVDWLKQLGDVIFNFSKLSISFKHNAKKITLTGTQDKASYSMMSGNASTRFFKKHTHGLIGQLFSISTSPPPTPPPPPISELLNQYSDVFSEPKSLPPQRNLDHSIPLKKNSEPVNMRPYKCPYLQKKLKNITFKDKFPIPIIDEFLDELHGKKFFSKIDLRAGYHQIRVTSSDIYKTAFRTHHGHFEFKVMPFGLTNEPATFQALMNDIFQEHLRKFIFVFFDDILVYSSSLEEHLLHLQLTLDILRKHQLFANFTKCCFGQQELKYLGHIITAEGVKADPVKISAMHNWLLPHTLKDLRGFLGLTSYYKKFVKNYGLISRPITDLLNKNAFLWSPAATSAFQQLKEAMSSTPILAVPNFNKPFVVETDACDTGTGIVLLKRANHWLSTGTDNTVVDALSRRPHESGTCQNIYISQPTWSQEIIDSYSSDAKVHALIAHLALHPATLPNYSYTDGVLIFKSRICVDSSSDVKAKNLDCIHSSAAGGHSGIQATICLSL